ncbi:MAG TPA: hypothetical protein VHS99_13785 [Chloroflexota bacterium]|jgi:hypothetical protein|nr:hypothetical protein [Chloroflexota bacterium]
MDSDRRLRTLTTRLAFAVRHLMAQREAHASDPHAPVLPGVGRPEPLRALAQALVAEIERRPYPGQWSEVHAIARLMVAITEQRAGQEVAPLHQRAG